MAITNNFVVFLQAPFIRSIRPRPNPKPLPDCASSLLLASMAWRLLRFFARLAFARLFCVASPGVRAARLVIDVGVEETGAVYPVRPDDGFDLLAAGSFISVLERHALHSRITALSSARLSPFVPAFCTLFCCFLLLLLCGVTVYSALESMLYPHAQQIWRALLSGRSTSFSLATWS